MVDRLRRRSWCSKGIYQKKKRDGMSLTAEYQSPVVSHGISGKSLLGGMSAPNISMNAEATRNNFRKIAKSEVVEAFLTNLRNRGNIDVDEPGFVEGIKEHFATLPSR